MIIRMLLNTLYYCNLRNHDIITAQFPARYRSSLPNPFNFDSKKLALAKMEAQSPKVSPHRNAICTEGLDRRRNDKKKSHTYIAKQKATYFAKPVLCLLVIRKNRKSG